MLPGGREELGVCQVNQQQFVCVRLHWDWTEANLTLLTLPPLAYTQAQGALSIRVLELPQLDRAHTQTQTHTLNMKLNVSSGRTAMYAFDFGMGSEIAKCKAPWYRSKLFYLDKFAMSLPLTYGTQQIGK